MEQATHEARRKRAMPKTTNSGSATATDTQKGAKVMANGRDV